MAGIPTQENQISSFQPAASGAWRLECRGASVPRGGRMVLHDVTLSLGAGECLSLIGPNGSGKTTLMLALLGLLKPAAGDILLEGIPVASMRARERGRWAAYVPQTLDGIPEFTVFDVVAAGRYPHTSPFAPLSTTDLGTIEAALAQCDLLDLADRAISAVSGGERQKTLIAAALAQDSQAMFLDEPDTALDPAYQIQLVRILRDWLARGRSIVIISHDLQLPAVLSSRVVALRGGRVIADGPAAEVLEPERLREIFNAEFQSLTTPAGHSLVLPRLQDS